MTAKAIENAQDPEKRGKMLLEVAKLRNRGFTVTDAPHALYANYNINFDNHRGITLKSTRIDPRALLIGSRAAFIRPFSTIAIPEAQTYFNARAFQKFTPEQARFFQTSGHFGIDIMLDTQDLETLDKTIRGLCEIYEIKERKIYNDRGKEVERAEPRDVSKIEFYYNYFQSQNGAPKAGMYTIDFNVYECYNSFENYEDYLPVDKSCPII